MRPAPLLLLVAVLACGNDAGRDAPLPDAARRPRDASTGPDGPTGESGLELHKTIESLSANDAARLCIAAEQRFTALSAQQRCRYAGIVASLTLQMGDFEALCNDAETLCLEDPRAAFNFRCGIAEDREGCTATVGDVEACYQARIATYGSLLGACSCADSAVAANRLEGTACNPPVPEACARITPRKCTSVL